MYKRDEFEECSGGYLISCWSQVLQIYYIQKTAALIVAGSLEGNLASVVAEVVAPGWVVSGLPVFPYAIKLSIP